MFGDRRAVSLCQSTELSVPHIVVPSPQVALYPLGVMVEQLASVHGKWRGGAPFWFFLRQQSLGLALAKWF